ncbi:hypothetical protein FRC01_010824 [Tulasnella sp. 417]|nr:hypothetical protein FRC01_010824 [Tulasnella sp. 417]
MSTQIGNQVDHPDGDSRASIANQAAKSEGHGNIAEPTTPPGTQSDIERRFKHNAALPVNSLPAELFLQVVHYNLHPFIEHNHSGYYSQVIGLSGVCSHWYNIIRDSPPVWTQIHSSDSPNTVEMALRRSSNHLIDVTIHEVRGHEHIHEFLNTIFPHRDRWRSLDVFTPSVWVSLLTPALDEPAINLQKLSLVDQDTVSSNNEIDLFRGTTPQLKDLALNGVSARWDSTIVHGLKFIDLSWIHFASTKTVLDILSHSPQLQRATVWRCTTGSIFRDSSSSIQLSRISFLQIDLGSLEAIDNILASLTASESSSLSIPLFAGENVGGFLRIRVGAWTSKWNVAPTFQLGGLQLDIQAVELRMGILAPSHPEPLTFTIEGFRIRRTELLVALSFAVDTLVSWSKGSATIHLKLGNSPSVYPFYEVHTQKLFVNELSRLPQITSLEISSIGEDSLADVLIREGAWSVFQNVRTLSFPGLFISQLSKQLEWISHTVRFIKAATESSLEEVDIKPKLQRLELRLLSPKDPSEAGRMEVAVKELEGIVGPGVPTCKSDLPSLRTFTAMSTQINPVDPPSQDSRTYVTNRLAKSDGRGNSPEPRSPIGIRNDVELRIKHNAALPIHSLPAELLLQVARYDLQPFFDNNQWGYYLHVIDLSGVCSYWYNVIRDSPPIWAQIYSSDSANIVELALQRSSSHLIDIVISTVRDQEHIQQFIKAILSHRNRWRSLDAFSATRWMSLLTSALDEPAPNLEKLSLNDHDTTHSRDEIDLFRGITPKLKELSLNGVSARWDSTLVHGLKSIDLSYIHFPSSNTVLDILSHSPQLQRATVWRCTTGSIFTNSSYSVQLSRLSFLQIDLGSLEAIDSVLAGLKASERSSLSIPLWAGENVGGFLRSRVAGWTSNWKVTPTFQFDGLQLEINTSNLQMGILTPGHPEPLTFAINGFSVSGPELLVAFSFVVDTLVSWAKKTSTMHLKLGYSPSAYPFYQVPTQRLFVDELSRLPPITSLEISGHRNGSLVDIVICEGASPLFRNVFALSFSELDPSVPSGTLEWISHTVRFIKTATESSLDQMDRKPKLQKVELRFFLPIHSNKVESVEAAVRELEEVVGPGTVFVIDEDQD